MSPFAPAGLAVTWWRLLLDVGVQAGGIRKDMEHTWPLCESLMLWEDSAV